MNSIWQSLLWKEWREQRWKMAALTAVLLATPAIIVALMTRMGPTELTEASLTISTTVLFPYALLAGMFVGMNVAAGENSRGTARFLASLPTPSWVSAVAKVSVAMLVIALPAVMLMIALWLVSTAQFPQPMQVEVGSSVHKNNLPWGMENLFVAFAVAGILGTWSVFLWTIAGGVNRSDEVRAGAVAFLLGAAGWLGFAGLQAIANEAAVRGFDTESLAPIVFPLIAALPGGPGAVNAFVVKSAEYLGIGWMGMAASALVSHALLLTWFLKRTGKVPARAKYHRGLDWEVFGARRVSSLPLRSPVDAIIWKQVREIAPLALVAVAGVLTLAPLVYWFDRMGRGNNRFGDILGSMTIAVAALVALVTGIGLLYEDYSKGVERFWRSRPLNVNLWFWVKYGTGLAVLFFAFMPILVFSYWILGWTDDTLLMAWFLVMFYGLLYAMALVWFSLVPQPVYAAVLSIATLTAGWVALVTMSRSGPPRWLNNAAGVSFLMLAPTVLTTLLAWQAVVRDWGWKQSR